jgi:hypothetical protein
MATKCKETPTQEDSDSKRQDTSDDIVYYKVKKLHKIPSIRIGKRPIYKFYIDYNNETGSSRQFPVQAILDLGSTSFTISPECAKAFKIPFV